MQVEFRGAVPVYQKGFSRSTNRLRQISQACHFSSPVPPIWYFLSPKGHTRGENCTWNMVPTFNHSLASSSIVKQSHWAVQTVSYRMWTVCTAPNSQNKQGMHVEYTVLHRILSAHCGLIREHTLIWGVWMQHKSSLVWLIHEIQVVDSECSRGVVWGDGRCQDLPPLAEMSRKSPWLTRFGFLSDHSLTDRLRFAAVAYNAFKYRMWSLDMF